MKIIDLTREIYTGMPSIPSDKHVKTEIKEVSNINKDNIERHQILMSCHSGTHIDVPRHLIQNGKSLDEIPLKSFIGKARKLIIDKKQIELDYVEYVKLNNLDFLIFQTGWERNWGF